MFVRAIEPDVSLLRLRELVLHSRRKLDSHPTGKSRVPIFDALLSEWWDVFKEYVALSDEQVLWRALVEYADLLLDDIVDQMDDATEGSLELRALFFEGQSASIIKRPIAGKQLKKLQQWVTRIQGESIPASLKALLPALQAAVEMASDAVKKEEEATEKLKTFNLTGPRKQLLDKVNKARNETFLILTEAFQKEPAAYRASLVRRFLVRAQEGGAGASSLEDELEEVKASLSAANEQVALLEARYQELLTKKAEQDRDEEEQKEKEARLVALQQEAAALQEELARKKKRKSR